MALNLFGPPTKDDIKVAYIDPILGLVEGVSINEANKYALKDPGTTFIFRDGNQTLRYLNINEVNKLNPAVDLVKSDDKCGGLSEKVEIGSPTIHIFGGGGIGAAANPIVGNDGALMTVDLIRGGNGYKFPPLVAARDAGNNGSGATFVSVIGEVVETTETFENEADFEEYEIESTGVGYGQNWGPNGEDLGPWDPKTYTEPGEDPISKEIGEFEELVRNLARKPYWSTRKNKPTKVTCSEARVIPSEYNVTFPVWNEFMNSYAISPVSPSNVRGSDFAGRLFTYEWTEDFPYDGEYTFRGLCDNTAQLYFDNLKVADLASFADAVIPIQKTITKGLHNIRVDLLNVPITETVTKQVVSPIVLVDMLRFYTPDFSGAAGNTHFYTTDPKVEFIDGNELRIEGVAWKMFPVGSTNIPTDAVPLYRLFSGGDHLYTISGAEKSSIQVSAQTAGSKYFFEGIVGYVYSQPGPDREAVYRFYNPPGGLGGVGPVPGEHFYTTSTDEVKTLASQGYESEGIAFYTPTVSLGSGATASPNSPIQVRKVFNTLDYISKANRTLWRTNPTPSSGNSLLHLYGIAPFDTLAQESQTESYAGTHVITWDNINFPVDGSYRIRMAVDDNVTLFIGDEQIKYNGFIADTNALKNPDYNQNIFFKAGNYTIRAELEQSNVGPLAKGNPMALAIDIEVTSVTETIISAKSWNENPMGIALTIDAPEPPIPQEPVPEQEGRCPNNPIWTTRFPSIAGYGYNDASGNAEVLNNRYNVPDVFGAANDIPSYKSQGFTDADIRNYIETVYKFIPGKIIGGAMQDLLNDPTWGQPTPGVPLKTIYNLETNTASPISSNFRSSNSSGWFPVQFNGSKSPKGRKVPWGPFFNRYAISPIRPLDTPGTDGGGIVFRNYWDIDIPYDGFYQFAAQRDHIARFYVDGVLAFDVLIAGDSRWKDFRNKPKFQKVFITKGRHVISVELENEATEAYDQVNQKIFRTLDWQVSLPPPSPPSNIGLVDMLRFYTPDFSGAAGNTHFYTTDPKVEFIDGNELRIEGVAWKMFTTNAPGTVPLYRLFSGGDHLYTISGAEKSSIEAGFGLDKPYAFEGIVGYVHAEPGPDRIAVYRFYNPPGGLGGVGPVPGEHFYTTSTDEIKTLASQGYESEGIAFYAPTPPPAPITGGLTSGTARDGITYEGPPLFAYKDNRWGEFMNTNSVSPFLPPLNADNPEINGVKTYSWKGVNFPESGQYDITFQADNNADLIVGGVKVLTSQGFAENSQIFNVNLTQGTYDVVVECNNIPDPTDIFNDNPTGFALEIRKNISLLRAGSGKSWDENPIGVGAILIPPPCPRKISGKGVVTDIIVTDPGNGFLPPVSPTPTPPSTVSVTPSVVPGAGVGAPGAGVGAPGAGVGAPGAGVGAPGAPGVSPTTITIVPPSGAPTGINARFIPQFEVIRDPIVVDPQQLLQVTDLVGLKQTGYVNGRPYYGSVYYDRGIRYAGFYETVGEPVRVYDTLRESIIAQVTTPPSAILRQGTDIRSNDPLLNIPGTVQSTLSSNSVVGAGDISTPSVPFTPEPIQDPVYPVSLRLKRVLVEDPGINYNVTDKIRVIPSNGAILEPVFGSFGRVIKVAVINPGFGFTEYPQIEMYTPL
jgi:hypothetical protein